METNARMETSAQMETIAQMEIKTKNNIFLVKERLRIFYQSE